MSSAKRRLNGTPVFMALAVVLILLIVIFAISAENNRKEYQKEKALYEAEAAVTPTPSATVPVISVSTALVLSADNSAVTQAPVRTPTPRPTAESEAILSVGSKGDEVKRLQQRLKDLGYLSGAVDGDFGSGTKAAVKWFQRQHGLAEDGVAGSMTKAALYADSAQRAYASPTPEPINVLSGDIPLLVNKQNPVDADFEPDGLVYLEDVIPAGLCTYKNKNIMGIADAVYALCDLLEAAHADGLTEWQFSEGYRTYAQQEMIFNNYVNNFMKENGYSRSQAISATRQTVADPGTSEHHTGLAFDITVPGKLFCDTAQYRWMKEHCWEYGFILRYTDEKQSVTGFLGEEWHYRYVGREHAMRMKNSGLCLEEYIDLLNRQ